MKVMRNQLKVIIVLLCFVVCIGFLSGCGKEILDEEMVETDLTVDESQTEENIEPVQEITETEEIQIFDTSSLELNFSSGAGAWMTSITLKNDGSFEGVYRDSNMGDRGEAYPNGSAYICVFSGEFDDVEQVNEYTYAMTLGEMNAETNEGEEWIEDGIRYIAADPYGLETGKEFLLYAPETPMMDLSEEFLSWYPYDYLPEEEMSETLSCYGLYNREMGYGFFTYENNSY